MLSGKYKIVRLLFYDMFQKGDRNAERGQL